jgi:nucleoside-diphosphate-sugar epimerase
MTIDSAADGAAVVEGRVLVTGAAGFIGSALCRALVRTGHEVHGASRVPRDGAEMCWWQVDLSDPDAVRRILRKVRPSVVFHLASRVSGDRALGTVLPTVRDNLLATVNVLTAACEADGRVVLAGSMEEVDPADPTAAPSSPYAAAKTAAGTYARLFHALYGLPVVSLRVFMVYGPGQRDTTKLIPYVTTALLRGEQPLLTSGTREIDWVFVDDVAAAFIAAARAPGAEGQSVDVGSGRLITIRSLVARLTHLVGAQVEPLFGALDDRPLETRRIADVARTETLIGWRPSTSLDVGLRHTIRWFAEREKDARRGP